MEEYFTAKRLISRSMNQAEYSKIGDKFTTLRFIVNGLAKQPKYSNEDRAMHLSGILQPIEIVVDRLIEEEAVGAETPTKKYTMPSTKETGRGRDSTWRGSRQRIRQKLQKDIVELVKKEIEATAFQSTSTVKHKCGKSRAAESHKHDDNGKTILESGELPTILNHNQTNKHIENVPNDIHTANGTMSVHQKCIVPIHLPKVAPIGVDALISPKMTTTLVSVKKVVDATGLVIFKKQGAYSLPSQLFDILYLRQKLATCHKGVYVIRS